MCDGKVVTVHGYREEVFQDFPSYCFLLVGALYYLSIRADVAYLLGFSVFFFYHFDVSNYVY